MDDLNRAAVCFWKSTRSPTGREPQGDGDPIVVRGRESWPHGEAGQVDRNDKEPGRRDVKSRPPENPATGEPCAWKSCPHGSGRVVTRSCGCTCYDWSYGQDITQCATTGTLPRRAAGAIRRCEALGTTSPHPFRVAGSPMRESRRLPASRRSGARVDGMANSGELPINVVRTSKPKALTGLNQKVSGQELGFLSSPAVAVEPPANRQSLNHP
jgi:hypothetical protein